MMDRLAQVALAMTEGLGPTAIRKLLDAYPGEDIFALPAAELRMAFGNHRAVVDNLLNKTAFARAEEELRAAEAKHIKVLFFTDEAFPQRLNREECADSPVLLYALGDADLNARRALAVVGTRKATAYGRDTTERIVKELTETAEEDKTLVVSGLAYGIDTMAHKASLENDLPTVAVLGHGLDRIYPAANRSLAERIVHSGGTLLTEYPMGTAINPRQFPARNRIIAAMSDATLVVEASEHGGALITATMAAGYQRDVFAVPGRLGDTYSCGTNNLIATNKALLVRSAADIAYQLGWPMKAENGEQGTQGELFPTLPPAEQKMLELLRKNGNMTIDEIVSLSGLPMPKAASLLFNLEMAKAVHVLPGHLYQAANA